MPSRVIREGWLESELINKLDANAERFFLRLCLRADDFGRYHANPMLLRSTLFPLRDDVKPADVSKWLESCRKAGLLRCYSVEGKPFIEIPKFEQRMRSAVSKFPQPAADCPQAAVMCPTDDGQMTDIRPTDDGPPLSESESESESDAESIQSCSSEMSDEESVWALYPKKKGKQEALPQIRKAIKAHGLTRILERTRAYRDAVSLWPEDERKFVPDPVRWFKRGQYDDDPETWKRNGGGGKSTEDVAMKLGYTY